MRTRTKLAAAALGALLSMPALSASRRSSMVSLVLWSYFAPDDLRRACPE
jgi:hypothetical protein